ncbi:transmembrane signal receptor [Lithospermum erythrorhizon]|uniref:Receptor-like serine/threonine-protein kinase n=1 Tax=Lithospermum erythrorhizon TaxID=34254 RepID=A0AAV3QVQ9_LITER
MHSKVALIDFSCLHWLILVVYSTSICCFAVDTIYQNQQIVDGQTIISAGNVFELGFFSPNGSTARYVGILYREYGGRVVWVANRERPLMDTSGFMMIGGDGNLVIIDGNDNSTIWSTRANFTSGDTTVVLNDIGNLVLRENKSDGLQFWQSFDHPSETWLPIMKIGVDQRTGEEINLSSWKSEDNPSQGGFVGSVDPTEPPQFLIWNNNNGSHLKHYRSGLWNGRSFTGLRFMNRDYLNGFTINTDDQLEGKLYFSIASFEESLPRLIYMNPLGALQLLDWDVEKMEWTKFAAILNSPCDYYATCGPYSICNDDDNEWSDVCDCFPGYVPNNIDEWDKGNWKGGCVRKEKFRCERNDTISMDDVEEDGFIEFQRMNLPDLPTLLKNSTDKDLCQAACLRNCSCTAYTYVDTIGCLIWVDDLIDTQSYSTANSGELLYLRLYHSELGGGKRRLKGFAIAIIVASTVLVGSSLFLAYVFCRWRKKNKGRGSSLGDFIKSLICFPRRSAIANKGSAYATGDYHTYDFSRGGNSEVHIFSLKDIQVATEFFALKNKLGEGGFGSVYKGKLPNGEQIAVKRLSRSSGQGIQEFENEVILISKLQHRNLVNLIGFCIQEEEKLLAYEYMPNKSLDKFIFGTSSDDETLLDWPLRYAIIEGIARGVVYLHRDSRLKIIHRDLKTSNILLDEEMNPKISDFGMARIFGFNQNAANTNRVVGTYGYMSPEYAMHGMFSEKSDVFSFGVVLLEIVTGRRNSGYLYPNDSINLPSHAWQLWNEEKTLELLDQRLVESFDHPSQVIKCVHVGLLCVQDNQNDRPTMANTLSMLINDNVILPIPKQPMFNINGRPGKENRSSTSDEGQTLVSGNSMPTTIIEGR